MNYDQIKTVAKENGLRVKDLCALAPKNDPFYVGTPADIESAEWFLDLWNFFGNGQGVHLRRVHYQAVSSSRLKPSGEFYENTDQDWNYLNTAAKNARYLGFVDAEAFIDRRNPDPVIHARWITSDDPFRPPLKPQWEVYNPWGDETDEDYTPPDVPTLPDIPETLPFLPSFYVDGYHAQQAIHVEIWCEKSTMNDVLTPLCERHGLNLVTGAGELSITAVVDFMRRVERSERPGRILYISDYDPAGFGMPVSVARKIEHFQRNEGFGHLDIALRPICLTPEQVGLYRLPRVPGKKTDRRKSAWDTLHGSGVVELDALEALHPGELAQLVSAEIALYRDSTLFRRSKEALYDLRSTLSAGRDEIIETYLPEAEAIDQEYGTVFKRWQSLRAEFAEFAQAFAGRLEDIQAHLPQLVEAHKKLCERVAYDLEVLSVTPPDVPTANLPDEPDSLYDSDRSYFDQLAAYNHHRNGTSQEALI